MNGREQNSYLLERQERIYREIMSVNVVNVDVGSNLDSGVSIYVIGDGSTGTQGGNEISRMVRSPYVKIRAFDSASFQEIKYRNLDAETDFFHLAEPDAETVLRNIELHPLLMERVPDIASNIRDRLTVMNNGAGGSRKAGFFLFYRNVEEIRRTLISDIAELRKEQKDRHLMVIVVGTGTGGTASSQMVELGYVTQGVLEDMGISDYSLIIGPILPITEEEPNSAGQLVKGRANSFKFWQELTHFMKCSEFEMRYSPSMHISSKRRPYDMIWPFEGRSVEEAVRQVALVVKALFDGNQAQALLARLQDKKDILVAGQIVGQPLACVAVAERSMTFDPTPMLNRWASEYGSMLLGHLLAEPGEDEDANQRAIAFLRQHKLTAQDIKNKVRQTIDTPDFTPMFSYNKQLPAKLRHWNAETGRKAKLAFSEIADELSTEFALAIGKPVDRLVTAGQLKDAASFLGAVEEELESEIQSVAPEQESNPDRDQGQDESGKSLSEEEIDKEIDNACGKVSQIVASAGYQLPIMRNIRIGKVARLVKATAGKVAETRKAQWNRNISNAVINIINRNLLEVHAAREGVDALIRRAESINRDLMKIASQEIEQESNSGERFVQLSDVKLQSLKALHFPSLDNVADIVPGIIEKIRNWEDNEALPNFLAWCSLRFNSLIKYTLVDILAEEPGDGFEPLLEIKQLVMSTEPSWHYTASHLESKPPKICIAGIGKTQSDEANQKVYNLLRQSVAENCIVQGRDPNRLDVSVYYIGLPPAAWKGIEECEEAYNEAERQGDQSYHIFGNMSFESPIVEIADYSRRAKRAYEDGLRYGLLVNGTGEYSYKSVNIGRSKEQVIATIIRNPALLIDMEMDIVQAQQEK